MDRLEQLQLEVKTFASERAWERFHDPKNLTMALLSEAGELAAELRWIDNHAADAHCAQEPARQRVVDELADVTVCVLLLANRLGVDLSEIVRNKLERTKKKYPVERSHGRAEAPEE